MVVNATKIPTQQTPTSLMNEVSKNEFKYFQQSYLDHFSNLFSKQHNLFKFTNIWKILNTQDQKHSRNCFYNNYIINYFRNHIAEYEWYFLFNIF